MVDGPIYIKPITGNVEFTLAFFTLCLFLFSKYHWVLIRAHNRLHWRQHMMLHFLLTTFCLVLAPSRGPSLSLCILMLPSSFSAAQRKIALLSFWLYSTLLSFIYPSLSPFVLSIIMRNTLSVLYTLPLPALHSMPIRAGTSCTVIRLTPHKMGKETRTVVALPSSVI